VINNNIDFFFRYNFPLNFKPLELNEEDSDNLTDFDRMEINTAKLNESELIINKFNIPLTINYMINKYKIKIDKKEFKYYLEHFKLNKFQKNMIFLFFAKHFGGIKSLYNCDIKQYLILLLILKRVLKKNNFIYLHKILTGRIKNDFSKKALNKKYILKVLESKKYQEIINNKFSDAAFSVMDSNIIIKMVSTVLNNKFTIVDYNNPKLLGEEIKIKNEIVAEEILRFIEII